MSVVRFGLSTAAGGIACAIALAALTPHVALAGDIRFRSFSASAAIGPPADAFAAKLQTVTQTAMGAASAVHFVRLPGLPAIPTQFAGDIVSAVAAGEAGGGFDAAYISGGDLNRAWGFIFNSGVPFGPRFDEFVGFLYGKSIDSGQTTGVDLVQQLLDLRGRNVIALPIVGSPEQMSGYFFEPMQTLPGHDGIGLAGLCEQPWHLRYLPPGENVLGQACDDLVASHQIASKNISFVQAIPGGGSLIDAVLAGTLDGFEFATPLDDVSQLFNTANNPGTVGLRFVHTPGWQQQFLVTWMLINKQVWSSLNAGQQILIQTVARDHVLASYGENLRQQGPSLKFMLDANKNDSNPDNDLMLTRWSIPDQIRLRDATIHVLNARTTDPTFSANDRTDYTRVLEALRLYVQANNLYWNLREVPTLLRFGGWANPAGQCWDATCPSQAAAILQP